MRNVWKRFYGKQAVLGSEPKQSLTLPKHTQLDGLLRHPKCYQ